MKLSKLVLGCVALFVMLTACAAMGDERKDDPAKEVRFGKSPSIRWRTFGEVNFFDIADTVQLVQELTLEVYSPDRPIEVHGLSLKVVITDADGYKSEKVVFLPAKGSYGGGFPSRRESVWRCSAAITLNNHFKPIPRGKSLVEFFLNHDSLTVEDKPLVDEEWIVGPSVIINVEPFEANRIPVTPDGDVVFRITRFETDDGRKLDGKPFWWSAEVTNKGNQPITIGGYVNKERPNDIACPLPSQEMRPEVGWKGHGIGGICGTGWGKLDIPAGKTQRIRVYPGGSGVARLVLPYTIQGEQERKTAYSQAFLWSGDNVHFINTSPEEK